MTVSIKKLAWFIFFIVFFIGTILGIYFGVQYKNEKDKNSQLYTEGQVEDKYRTYVEQIKNKNATIEELNDRLTICVEQLSNSNEEIKSLTAQIEEKNTKLSEVETQLAESQANESELRQQKETLIAEKADLQSTLNSKINELQEASATIASLTTQVSDLQAEVTRLQGLLESYEEIKNGTAEANFYIKGKLFKTIAVQKGKSIDSTKLEEPTSNYFAIYYKAKVTGWKVGETVVDINTYVLNEDTIFNAEVIDVFEVKYMADGNQISTGFVVSGEKARTTTFYMKNLPTKDGYVCLGYSVNGTDVVDLTTLTITEDTTLYAVFTKGNLSYNTEDNQVLTIMSAITNGTTIDYNTKLDFNIQSSKVKFLILDETVGKINSICKIVENGETFEVYENVFVKITCEVNSNLIKAELVSTETGIAVLVSILRILELD